MRLSERLVDLMAFEVARDLVRAGAVVAQEDRLSEMLRLAITDDLRVEDKLDDEVRETLKGYEGYMRANNIEYSEMAERIKRKMIQDRKLVL